MLTSKMSANYAPSMAGKSTDVLQGTLDLLILKTLALEPMHGFGIARRIEQVSEGVFRVNPGSLLLAFRRLERDGLVEGEWRETDNSRRARFYRLTAGGRRRLKDEAREWERRVSAMARVLESS
jgi:PadR family transcriptional regulator PadR